MDGILLLTLARIKEPAFMVLALIGCLMSICVATTGPFDSPLAATVEPEVKPDVPTKGPGQNVGNTQNQDQKPDATAATSPKRGVGGGVLGKAATSVDDGVLKDEGQDQGKDQGQDQGKGPAADRAPTETEATTSALAPDEKQPPGSSDKSNAPPRPKRVAFLVGTLLLTIFACLVTIFNTASEIPRDLSSGMIAMYLSKPISRRQYMWGKCLGSLALGGSLAGGWLLLMLVWRAVFYEPAPNEAALGLGGALAQFLALAVLLPVTAIAICISCFMSDVASMIVASVYLGVGFVVGLFPIIITLLQFSYVGKIILFVYYFAPNLYYFLDIEASFWGVTALIGYGFAICCIFITVGLWQLENEDLM